MRQTIYFLWFEWSDFLILNSANFKSFSVYIYIRILGIYDFLGTVNSDMPFVSIKHIVSAESKPKSLLDKTQDPVIFHLTIARIISFVPLLNLTQLWIEQGVMNELE